MVVSDVLGLVLLMIITYTNITRQYTISTKMTNRNRKCDEEFAHLVGIWVSGKYYKGFVKTVELDTDALKVRVQ